MKSGLRIESVYDNCILIPMMQDVMRADVVAFA